MSPLNSISGFLITLLLILTGLASPVCFDLQAKSYHQQSSSASLDSDPEFDEIFLEFRYRNIINTYLTGWYYEDVYFLPLTGLFSIMQIDYNWDAENNTLTGFYIDQDEHWSYAPESGLLSLGSNEFRLGPKNVLHKEAEIFMSADVFGEVFGLHFTVNFQRMLLNLSTNHTLPAESLSLRRRNREKLGTATPEWTRPHYDLRFDRQRAMLGGFFADYNLAWNHSAFSDNRSGRFGYGAELLGGDIQGHFSFSRHQNGTRYDSRDIRWRYVFDHKQLSYISAGEVWSRGLSSRSFYGLQLSNEPVEPRRLFGDWQIKGYAGQGYDVELYVNGRLISYMNADEAGQYRFDLPVTYGSALVNVRKYGPAGSYSEESRRVNISSALLRPGEFTWHADAGWTSRATGFSGFEKGEFMTQVSTGFGINDRLTVRTGVEYFERNPLPVVYATASARVLDQYILGSEVVPGHYYRASGYVQYPGLTSFQFTAASWNENSLYNLAGIRNEVQASFFLPLIQGRTPLSYRLGVSRNTYRNLNIWHFDTGLNARYHRFNLQAGYREMIFNGAAGPIRQNRTASAGLLYLFENRSGIPVFLRSIMLRTDLRYAIQQQRMESISIGIDRQIGRYGRVSTSMERNYARRGNFFALSITFDFPQARTTGSVRSGRNETHFYQQIQGSVGYDKGFNRLVFDNRQNVGQAGAAIRMIVDDGNEPGTAKNGKSSLIPANAIRFHQTTNSRTHDDGINRVTHLMPYTRYSIEILTDRIKNPHLIPEFTEFSFVTDPNGFKKIDIPLLMSGEVDGSVRLDESISGATTVNGLRVVLHNLEHSTRDYLTTFSDGSFYKLGVRPGSYRIYPDSVQTAILGLISDPPYYEITLMARADGDYAEGLDFQLMYPAATDDLSEESEPGDDETAAAEPVEYGLMPVKFWLATLSPDSLNMKYLENNSQYLKVMPAAVIELTGRLSDPLLATPGEKLRFNTAPDLDQEQTVSADSLHIREQMLTVAQFYTNAGFDPRYLRLNMSTSYFIPGNHSEYPYTSVVTTTKLTSLHPVIFALDSHEIEPEYEQLLDENTAYLLMNSDVSIRIEAYSDDVGSLDYNQWLTARRAAAVRNHYITRGIDAGCIIIKSLGIAGSPCVLPYESQGCSVNRRADTLLVIDDEDGV